MVSRGYGVVGEDGCTYEYSWQMASTDFGCVTALGCETRRTQMSRTKLSESPDHAKRVA